MLPYLCWGELSVFMSQDNETLKRLIISGTFLFLLLMINLESEMNSWVLYLALVFVPRGDIGYCNYFV